MPTKTALTALALSLTALAGAHAAVGSYPAMAPVEQYRIASAADEIAMARSAAPASISAGASVMVMGPKGYETAATGQNGFVCMVQRAWGADFADAEFWNPKNRSPICFNAAAVRSVLPTYLERTNWVLAGTAKAEMLARTKAEVAGGKIPPPAPGAMAYMMSKQQYLGDAAAGHWHPHMMFYEATPGAAAWGAGAKGSPVMGGDAGTEPGTVFFVIVPNWSDGTPVDMKM